MPTEGVTSFFQKGVLLKMLCVSLRMRDLKCTWNKRCVEVLCVGSGLMEGENIQGARGHCMTNAQVCCHFQGLVTVNR